MPLELVREPEGDDWARLLRAWGRILDEYEARSVPEPDVAYWHSEQALTSLLAMAAWEVGGVGFVEFSTERRRDPAEEPVLGWGDAWLRVGTKWYAVEAKLCWGFSHLEPSLALAVGDLWSLNPEDRAAGGLALCYCVPEVSGRASEEVVRRLARDGSLSAMFFVATYTPKGSVPTHEGFAYPGMLAVGRLLRCEVEGGNDPWQRAARSSI